jgi:succinate dehydrogenase / fumarate reductase cytochrome b subunit
VEPEARVNALDRAFALTSVLPLGAWLGFHVCDYARVLFGTDEIGARAAPSTFVIGLELVAVWLPLAFHALWGVRVWLRRRKREESTPSRKALTALHRLAGAALVPFLIDHFLRFRLPILRGERLPSDSVQLLAAELSRTDAGVPWLAAATLLGTAGAVFHLGYGAVRSVERSPRLAGAGARGVCVGIAVTLGVAGVFAVVKLATG